MDKLINFSSNYAFFWALDIISISFCWALNACSINFVLGSKAAFQPNKNLYYTYLEPYKNISCSLALQAGTAKTLSLSDSNESKD